MNKLSVVIIVKNEEADIRRCLESVKWADEIVIVDDMSTDKTIEICGEYTNKIYRRKMEGFGPQKQYGVQQAAGEWILSIDADEIVTAELAEEIRKAIGQDEGYSSYYIYRKNNYLGRWMRYCGWYVPILRLFKKEKGGFNSAKVHEEIIVGGGAGLLKNEILHYTYRDISDHLEKINLFTDYGAEELIKKGVVLKWYNYPWYFIFNPLFYFLKKYIYLQGFREGTHGFILCIFAGIVVFIKYAKVWKKQNINKACK